MQNIEQKIKQLISELNAASKAYYGGSAQIMPDAVWNAKFDELSTLERQYNIVLPCSPTQHVSHENIVGEKVTHEFPALSLPKSKSKDDVIKWTQKKSVDLSWKLDGMTLVVTYDGGKLTRVVTRGDGEVGSDITHLSDAIGNIQKVIDYKGHLVIRGEAVIAYADFESINEKYDNVYENPRNLVAGSLNPLTQVELIMDRCITWIPFTLVYVEEIINSWNERMHYLKTLGFKVVDSELIDNIDALSGVIDKWSDQVEYVQYPVDGLVVVYDDIEYASGGTLTGHHDTRGGFAFKWADEEAETELVDIEWSVSINSINPVAIFKPVRLEGTTVQRASLCNISECERLGIGDIGTKLTVIKANKIIPKVIKASQVGVFNIPTKCPVCGYSTEIKTGLTDTKVLVCENDNCAAKNISKMSRFVSKYGFDISGLSERTLMDLLNKGLIKTSIDIFELLNKQSEVYDVLLNADGWGEKSIQNLLQSIDASKSVKAENLLYSLCIPMCGRDVAKKLTKQYSLSEIVKLAKDDAKQDTNSLMGSIEGIGQVKAKAFIDWFKNFDNVSFVDTLINCCNVKDNNSQSNTGSLQGVTFVITGSLNEYASRDILKDLIESKGGKVASSVSAKTNYLINNDVTSSSSKNKKAKDLGVPIISEEEFNNMFLQ